MKEKAPLVKGRGAQVNPDNPFSKTAYGTEHMEGVDEVEEIRPHTEYIYEHPKQIVNKVSSPDIGPGYSLNPYQGCEHGCAYCYARNAHFYWGYSAGVDFETKIIIKEEAPQLLEKQFLSKRWKPAPIMLSGNTDCYQPLEKKLGITRKLLEVFLKYRNPVGIITKNSLILRDKDLLEELARLKLVHVSISITTLDEELRRLMEPRTAHSQQRLKVVKELSEVGIPINVMVAPIIPGLNHHEIPDILKAAAENGAMSAAFTMVRLNGALPEIFSDWIHKAFPEKAERVLNQIRACHGGQINDSRFGTRMRGEGPIAESIRQLFKVAYRKYFKGQKIPPYDLSLFRRSGHQQLSLFD